MSGPTHSSHYEDSLGYYLGNAEDIGMEWPTGADVSRFYRAVRIGFCVQSAFTVRQRTHIESKVFNAVLPRTTLQSRQQSGRRLTPEQSEKVLRIAHAYARAAEVFGDQGRGEVWMDREHPELDDQTPAELLDTEFGARRIEQLLGRIEHGIAA
jgi:putative toxin-antitoxin system antitoxin component (TIGR02293 family)